MPTQTKRKPKTAKAAPPVVVTLATFDAGFSGAPVMRVIREATPIAESMPLRREDYSPRGGTPLRDATALFLAHLGEVRTANPGAVIVGALMDESGSMGGNEPTVIDGINEFVGGMRDVANVDQKAGGKVLAVVFTDGHENASTEIDAATLSARVAACEADGYTFIFMGANIDAWSVGQSQLGVSATASGQAVNFVSTPLGTASALTCVTSDASNYLADFSSYGKRRSSSSLRSIAEDGTESV